jgi:hypothetical protein
MKTKNICKTDRLTTCWKNATSIYCGKHAFVITEEDETHASQQTDERTISIASMGFCPIIVMEER